MKKKVLKTKKQRPSMKLARQEAHRVFGSKADVYITDSIVFPAGPFGTCAMVSCPDGTDYIDHLANPDDDLTNYWHLEVHQPNKTAALRILIGILQGLKAVKTHKVK